MAFVKATRKRTKIRAAFAGPAGQGKTVTSLQLATALGGKIALGDTEGESASKYGDLFNFDAATLTDYHPNNFVQLIKDAESGGYSTLIIDSLSHEYMGKGGVLDLVDKFGSADKFNKGWKTVTPLHQALVEAILNSQVNIIATLRSKMAYESGKDENGKAYVKKLGMAPQTREGTEYEFDFLFDLEDGMLKVSKSRAMGYIEVGETYRRNDYPTFFTKLSSWANAGVEDSSAADKAAAASALTEDIKNAQDQVALKACAARIQLLGLAASQDIRAAYTQRNAELKEKR